MTTPARAPRPKPEANPVYQRITAGDRGPSPRATRWIGIGAGLAGFALAAGLPLAAPASPSPAYLLGLTLLGVLLVTLGLPSLLAGGASVAARYASREDFALLRLTGLTSKEIVGGAAAGVVFRLRAARMGCLWLPVGIWAGAVVGTFLEFLRAVGWPGQGYGLLMVLLFIFLAGMISGAALILRSLTVQMVRTGTALSLLWRHANAMPAMLAAAAAVWPTLVIAALLLGQRGPWFWLGVLLLVMVPVTVTLMQDRLLTSAAAHIEKEALAP